MWSNIKPFTFFILISLLVIVEFQNHSLLCQAHHFNVVHSACYARLTTLMLYIHLVIIIIIIIIIIITGKPQHPGG